MARKTTDSINPSKEVRTTDTSNLRDFSISNKKLAKPVGKAKPKVVAHPTTAKPKAEIAPTPISKPALAATPSKAVSSVTATAAPTTNWRSLSVVPQLESQACPFREMVDEWIAACRADGLSPKTIGGYSDTLGKFRWWWIEYRKQPAHPENVTPKDARDFASYLREPLGFRWGLEVPIKRQQLSAASIATYGRTVKIFFAWLERDGYIDKSPFNRSVKFSTKKTDKIIKKVAEDDLAKLFAVLAQYAAHDSYAGLRNLAMLSLLIDSGIRRGELLSVRLCDMDFKAGRCSVKGKTGTRYAIFSETCKRALTRYFRKWRSQQDQSSTSPFWMTEDGEPLSYNGFGSVVRQLEKKSGVDFYAHKLRHTFATMMAQQDTNVFDLKEMLGHTSITTTQIYIQGEIEHLTQVHRNHSPLSTLNNGTAERVKRRRGRPPKAAAQR